MELLHLFILLGVLLVPAILAAFAADVLRSAIALLFASVGLTLILFMVNAPLAAVFELSVAAGLITVLFVLTLSLIQPWSESETLERKKAHYRKFIPLPFILAVVAAVMWMTRGGWAGAFTGQQVVEGTTVGEMLWYTRGLDLVGQVVILLAGVYGVVTLFKRGKQNE
ncbi:MAG TPA: NADH-quinone oxidoreductase subunit J [Bacillota bacterium]|nr:NADH-quinone oxidoreductase subunit J [Bacillota bacterium]